MNKLHQHHTIRTYHQQSTTAISRRNMNLLLATICLMLYTVTAHPHSSTVPSHTHRGTSTSMTQEQRTLCRLLDYILCGHDLCGSSYCYYHPDAVCRVVSLQCGCRAAWFTRYGQVDCNVPRAPRRRLSQFQQYLQDQFRQSTGMGGTASTASINRMQSAVGRNLPMNPQPGSMNQQPVSMNLRPVSMHQQPVSMNQQPVSMNLQPVSMNLQPVPMNPQQVPMNPRPMDTRQVVVDPNPISMDPNPASIVCPDGVLRVECQYNPCIDAPEMPGTTCTPNYCGGCTADIYRNGMKEYCADCEFPQLIIRSSVVKTDHSAYVNTYRNVQPDVPTSPRNTAPWTEAGPPIPLSELYVLDAIPSSFSKSSTGLSNTASSVLDLQGNIGSVSHIGQPSPQIPNAGLSSTGSSILALQGNIASVSHISQPSPQIPNAGLSSSGSSILALQGNIGSVSHLSSSNQQPQTMDQGSPILDPPSHSAVPSTGVDIGNAINGMSKTPTDIRRRYLVSREPSYVVESSAACPNGKRQAKCYSDPCLGRTCETHPTAVCRPSQCGNCEAKWYLNDAEVDCERCNGTTWVTSCPLNPCDIYSCPAYPHAECRKTQCGTCNDLWFVDGQSVDCGLKWPVCTEKENQACKETCTRDHCPTDYEAFCRVKGCGASCKLEYYKVVEEFFVPVSCQLRGTW